MRVTKASVHRACAVCERTLLQGEYALRYSPDGLEFVDVCPLCQDLALEAGWIKEGAPTTPTLENGRRRRRKRTLTEFLGLTRSSDEEALARQEPILRKLSEGEVALLEAADLFNGSAYRRTVGGIAKSLGEPNASIVPLSGTSGELAVTVAWELSWYQYRVSPDSSGQPVRLERRGHELDELDEGFKDWNAQVEDEGRLVPEIARL